MENIYYNGFENQDNRNYIYEKKTEEKAKIKKAGKITGVCIIAYFFISNIITLPVLLPGLRELFQSNSIFQDTVIIITSIIALIIPFWLAGNSVKKTIPCNPAPLGKPHDMKLAAMVIFLGVFLCLAANYVTGVWVDLFHKITGYTLTQNEYQVPETIMGKLYFVLTIAVVPPLCEELAIRGTVMQPLRRYGDRFAILVSAFVFGILHGNLIQAPFAFIAGIGLGYAVCITGSLWPSIIIHLVNNLYSCVTEFMVAGIKDEALLNKVYIITLIAMYAISITGSVFFFFVKGNRRLNKITTYTTPGEKIKAFFLNIPMIIGMLIMFLSTALNITK